ncbi:MAG: hypothetical protein Kow00109_09260 [Acidobacteriota bacterium]
MRLIEREGRIGRWRWRWLHRRGVDYGSWGEWIALGHLLAEGFDVVARRWRCRAGELDLVAYDGDELVFVEVKTRRTPTAFAPEVAVGAVKQARLELLADLFRARYELFDGPARFDLIAIETPDLRHYKLRHYEGVF